MAKQAETHGGNMQAIINQLVRHRNAEAVAPAQRSTALPVNLHKLLFDRMSTFTYYPEDSQIFAMCATLSVRQLVSFLTIEMCVTDDFKVIFPQQTRYLFSRN